MFDIDRFREARGQLLGARIARLADELGRRVRVLDLGGRTEYWRAVDLAPVSEISFLNVEPAEIGSAHPAGISGSFIVGDACDLSDFADDSYDLVHANSVIEHVGGWTDMVEMASEMRRVGRAGWCQTPAWGFPIEPHFRIPLVHWLPAPAAASVLRVSPRYRDRTHGQRRHHVERINLVSRAEMELLFPRTRIDVERFVLVKSYVAHW